MRLLEYSFVFCYLIFPVLSCKSKKGNTELLRVCYYKVGEDNLTPSKLNTTLCTHIIAGFSSVEDGVIKLGDDKKRQLYRETTSLKKKNPKLKVLLTIGGGGNNSGFSQAYNSTFNRHRQMQPEKDFVQGRSDNLPKIDSFTMFSFLSNNPAFFSAEMKNVKMRRSGRESYGDQAIGYVQLKREGNLCTVMARITPEHKVRNKPYSVTLTVDENTSEILSVECKDCTASLGGCKHAVAFIAWVHRRTEEPSPTSVANYWKKSKLSKVGTTVKFIRAKDLPSGKKTAPSIQSASNGNFLDCFLEEQNQTDCIVSRYFNGNDLVKHLSIHLLAGEFFQSNPDGSAEGFVSFCQNNMTAESCEKAEKLTQAQSRNPLWFELRHARITASKIYEASHSKTLDGSLFEVLMGSSKFRDTAAMARGRKLEGAVVKVVEKLKNIKFIASTLAILHEYDFDGLDVDWEFPVWNNAYPEDKNNFVSFLEEFYFLSKSYAHQLGKDQAILSVAVAAPVNIVQSSYNITEMAKYVNFINLMTYDFHDFHWYTPVTGSNSPLFKRSVQKGYFATLNTAWAANYWFKQGMPKNKIMVGIPTYGHSYKLISPIFHGVNAPAAGMNGDVTFTQVCKTLKAGGTRVFDNESKVPYAYHGYDWMSYEDSESMHAKANWIKSQGFGGAMTFDLNSDDWQSVCDKIPFLLHRILHQVFTT
ncbi:hypothetical protein JTE90_015406 [Oedothorax gibbosus]|uniref:GH18 domain-containing protein n=1 Tax=Oedothorax gibbosus TaxID=931172 RepID=A0AAV6U7B3_9ARAC|nr:hypothetical protein JTE90_015406 [Oedothorax gibbosus]